MSAITNSNLRSVQGVVMQAVFRQMYCPNGELFRDGHHTVKACVCQETNAFVAVAIGRVPEGYNPEAGPSDAFNHPLLTDYVSELAYPDADLLFTVSSNPMGLNVYDFVHNHCKNNMAAIRKNVQTVMKKMLSLLKDLEAAGLSLRPMQDKGIILTVKKGEITDIKIHRSLICPFSQENAKESLKSTAAMFNASYWFATRKTLPLQEEYEFFRGCQPDSEMTLDELMELDYINTETDTWVVPEPDFDTMSVHTAYDPDDDKILASDTDDDDDYEFNTVPMF
uniref:DNA-directed RNA polymerase n=1 Tax=Panagrellus redivivus TaxID=6233 RepID=A0A7E4WD86_PANRE